MTTESEKVLILARKLKESGFYAVYGSEKIPFQYIDVGWGSKETDAVATFGNSLLPSQCLCKPTVWFRPVPDKHYSIIAFDANEQDQCYLLWLRRNVTGDLRFSTGRDAFRWQPPHPREESGVHRLFVAVFEQPGPMPVEQPVAMFSKERRSGLKLRDHVEGMSFIGANHCSLSFESGTVDTTLSKLRDVIELDPTGRRVVAEIHNGVRTEF